MIELSRYALEVLRKDEELILYRGRSKEDTSPVLVVSPVGEHPTPESLKRLDHEYSLREELDPAWAARPIAMARHWDLTVLVLEDPGGMHFKRAEERFGPAHRLTSTAYSRPKSLRISWPRCLVRLCELNSGRWA